MKKTVIASILFIALSCAFFPQSAKNVSAEEAFQMLQESDTYLVDVRSIAEYVFVGHSKMAYNVPLLLWNERKQKLESNQDFLRDIRSRFKPDDTLIFICRSGGRSSRAYRQVKKAGFKKLYNVEHGFEGDKDAEGYRSVNGWRNSKLPYTFELDHRLAYRFK